MSVILRLPLYVFGSVAECTIDTLRGRASVWCSRSRLVSLACFAQPATSTDLLSFEGIGTVPRSMGGTALAYDVGGSAMANNVATILLMPPGQSVDLQLNLDAPNTLDVQDLATGEIATTDRWPVFHAYYSPNLDYVWRAGDFGLGLGLFSDGGLGTEYGHDSFLSRTPSGVDTGLAVSSKGLFLRAPLAAAYQITPALAVGGAFEGVFAGLSLSDLGSADQLATLAAQGRAFGSLLPMIGPVVGATGGAYFSFSRPPEIKFGTDAFGISGRLGATYRLDEGSILGDQLSVQDAVAGPVGYDRKDCRDLAGRRPGLATR